MSPSCRLRLHPSASLPHGQQYSVQVEAQSDVQHFPAHVVYMAVPRTRAHHQRTACLCPSYPLPLHILLCTCCRSPAERDTRQCCLPLYSRIHHTFHHAVCPHMSPVVRVRTISLYHNRHPA